MTTVLANIALPTMDSVTVFGLIAVSLMLVFYACESRSNWFVLAFAVSCAMGSVYGFMQGAWPFGLVEGVWSLVALHRWHLLGKARSEAEATSTLSPVDAFMEDLLHHARSVGPTRYQFDDENGKEAGFVQIYRPFEGRILIHRLWSVSLEPGTGTRMLQTLCDLADLHGIEITLRPLPFGPKPYRRSVEELFHWYSRYGFAGNVKKMVRVPQPAVLVGA